MDFHLNLEIILQQNTINRATNKQTR